MIEFLCNIDNKSYKAKPTGQEIGSIVKRMKCRERTSTMTANTLSEIIKSGKSFTTAALNGTTEADFISQQLAVVDIDNDKKDIPIMTVEGAINTLAAHGIPYSFIYYSFSHSTDTPKFRIVIILDKEITDPNEARRLNKYMISLFPQADESCFNLDRFYYGTNKKLPTDVHDRAAKIIIPEPDPVQKRPTPEQPKQEPRRPSAAGEFDLTQAIRDFNLLEYVEQTTGTQGMKKGKDFLFNPCPVCRHKDDFYIDTDRNVYKCHSAANGTGGNIITYLEQTRKLDRKAAREYFIYDICGQDRDAQKQEFKKKRRENTVKDKIPAHPKLINKLREIQPQNKYYWNDLGSSRLFAEIFSDYFKYNYTAKSWYVFDGKKWIEDVGSAKALKQFENLYDALLTHTTTIEDIKKKTDYLSYVLRLGKASERNRILEDAENLCAVSKDDFDKNNDLFNCQNGTLNLKTFKFAKHNPADLLTKISNVHYDEKAKSPRFESFMNEVMQGDAEKTEYLQKAFGYGLTANTHYETCFILYGATKRNGKSTLASTMMYMLGDYALDMKPETLAIKKNVDSRQASGDLARLDGCRFLNVSEPQKRLLLDVTLLKQMTGRNPITARNLYEREFTFYPTFKIFMDTNHLPLVTDDDLFVSDRINIITFDRHFEEHERDTTLKDRLITQENISGIFNWCLQGLNKFIDDGLKPPQTVKDATTEYKDESDKIGNFINDCLERKQGENCKVGDVYFIYEQWCGTNGYGCENSQNFNAELRYKKILAKHGYVNGVSYKNVVRGYIIKKNAETNETPPPSDKDAPPKYGKAEDLQTEMEYPHF
jgi:putative DNA primase/helicase